MNTNFATIQNIRRNYKKVVEQVNKTNTPTIIISNNQPQFAIINLDMLKKLQITLKGAQGLLALARWAEKEHIKGPKDLSTNHDKYIWNS